MIFVCSVYNLNNKNVNALVARELSGIYLHFFTNNEFEIFNIENFAFVSEQAQVNPNDSLAECVVVEVASLLNL